MSLTDILFVLGWIAGLFVLVPLIVGVILPLLIIYIIVIFAASGILWILHPVLSADTYKSWNEYKNEWADPMGTKINKSKGADGSFGGW